MRLDLLAPRYPSPAAEPERSPFGHSGTNGTPAGVLQHDRSGGNGGTAAVRPRAGLRGWALVLLGAASLLGQGERCVVDRRFESPSATLATYWEALRANDEATVAECMLGGPEGQPFAGMLWFMPPTRELHLGEFRLLPVTGGRVMVTYEVSFHPVGALEEQRFQAGNELVRRRGEWRIARTLGNASMPEWRPIPRAVDI